MYPNKFYETIIVPVVLYGCETKLKGRTPIEYVVNKVLRRISVPKTVEITQGWRKLHDKERHYLSPVIVVIK
jgi:hypothetical protein